METEIPTRDSVSPVSSGASAYEKRQASLKAAVKGFTHLTRHADELAGVRIENAIGFVPIPVGLAGPLTINGYNQKATVYAPLATTEAALVASCSRGAKAFELCGGVKAFVHEENMSRVPTFKFASVDKAVVFYRALDSLFDFFKAAVERKTSHGKLTSTTGHLIGRSVHVRFAFSCGDAAGQNMVTLATHSACHAFMKSEISNRFEISGFYLEGNMNSDKKLSWGNTSTPGQRGVSVTAWGTLTNEVSLKVLGTTTEAIYATYLNAIQGAVRNGMLGFSINTANVMAAMFIALGQDAASILEGGWTHLTMEYDTNEKVLTASLYIPSLPIGTVGGGTVYPAQNEALQLLNCVGEGKKWALAETMAAFMVCLDLSTCSAITNDTFSGGHEKLGRSKL